jgi:hypothetical protein
MAGGLLLLDTEHNRLFAYNDTARFIWDLIELGQSAEDAVKEYAASWGISDLVARNDISSIVAQWRQQGLLEGQGRDSRLAAVVLAGRVHWKFEPEPHWAREWTSTVRGRMIQFAVENDIASTVYEMFRQLETPGARPHMRFQIRDVRNGQMALVEDGVERLRTEDGGQLIGALWQAILECVHPDVRWLAIIHGAAFARDGRAFGLCAPSGSGKSTLVAGLLSKGFDYLADDMISLSSPDGSILPLPLPLSIKSGSVGVLSSRFPSLAHSKPYHTKGVDARLLVPPNSVWNAEPAPLRKLIFPRFAPEAKAELKRLSAFEALEQLLAERIWLGDPITEPRVTDFLNLLNETPTYSIAYGNLDDGVRLVEDIVA